MRQPLDNPKKKFPRCVCFAGSLDDEGARLSKVGFKLPVSCNFSHVSSRFVGLDFCRELTSYRGEVESS